MAVEDANKNENGNDAKDQNEEMSAWVRACGVTVCSNNYKQSHDSDVLRHQMYVKLAAHTTSDEQLALGQKTQR